MVMVMGWLVVNGVVIMIIHMLSSALRTAFSWSENRDVFNAEATLIRAEFDANKNHGEGKHSRLLLLHSLCSFLMVEILV